MDLVGPLDQSEEGHNYILNIADVLSGYIVLRALKSKSEEDVAISLWSVIGEYGPPKIVQSDQGTEFLNSVINELSKINGIERRMITAYNPRADGLVEIL